MRRIAALILALPALLALLAAPAFAGEVEIVDARAARSGDQWRFDVTLRHADEGWDHYADAWQIRDADGAVLGTRTLVHPHVNEQPFTRSLGGVTLPGGLKSVRVYAHDNVHGWAKAYFDLDL